MFETIQGIKNAVDEHQGVLTLSMAVLRDAYGAGKLGKHILNSISRELSDQGLGHFPDELPSYQHGDVRIFKLGSPVADIIDAVFQVGYDQDELLRQAVAGDEAILLRQIRELLCQ